jgi:hypothetical protein
MDPFLTLCERARASYPAETFADQVLAILGDGPDNLKGWHGTIIPARIAELVQHFEEDRDESDVAARAWMSGTTRSVP